MKASSTRKLAERLDLPVDPHSQDWEVLIADASLIGPLLATYSAPELATWDEDADGRLADILEAALPAAMRARMEELMRTGKYEYQSDFAKKYFALGHEEGREEGRAAGEARALLLVLRSRAVDVPTEAAQRIEQERDRARLEVWIRRAVTAATIDDVFADE